LNILYLTFLLNGLLMIAIPVILAEFLVRKLCLSWRLFFIGGTVFVLSQVAHIPFNILLNIPFRRGFIPLPPREWLLPFNAIIGGLSAGIFEEGARALMYKYWTKKERWWGEGVLLGTGHGGAEAIILGALVLWTYINMAALRGANPSAISSGTVKALASYWSVPWSLSLLGAVERALIIPFHIAASLIVLQAFTRRQPVWILLAVLWHAIVDAAAVYFGAVAGPYTTEAILALFAAVDIAIIFLLREPRPIVKDSDEPLPPVEYRPVVIKETSENLDKTRYQ
jgi:uncharacterized membrane protein YhfC